MERKKGIITKGIGGLYEVFFEDGTKAECKARGVFRHEKESIYPGDRVVAELSEQSACIVEIMPRKNFFIRPPLANLDVMFIVIAATNPEPAFTTTDKLISICEYNKTEPVIIVSKSDIGQSQAEEISSLYSKSGFDVFVTGKDGDKTEISEFIISHAIGKISAFAGASGVGKTTLMNELFLGLSLETGETSRKTERGRHTTKKVELYTLSSLLKKENVSGFIADTPGFSLLDFVRFDFFPKEELVYTFREFSPYLGFCRYTKCSHTKEDGCAVLEAVSKGLIPASRHQSYTDIRAELNSKKMY